MRRGSTSCVFQSWPGFLTFKHFNLKVTVLNVVFTIAESKKKKKSLNQKCCRCFSVFVCVLFPARDVLWWSWIFKCFFFFQREEKKKRGCDDQTSRVKVWISQFILAAMHLKERVIDLTNQSESRQLTAFVSLAGWRKSDASHGEPTMPRVHRGKMTNGQQNSRWLFIYFLLLLTNRKYLRSAGVLNWFAVMMSRRFGDFKKWLVNLKRSGIAGCFKFRGQKCTMLKKENSAWKSRHLTFRFLLFCEGWDAFMKSKKMKRKRKKKTFSQPFFSLKRLLVPTWHPRKCLTTVEMPIN